MSQVYCVFRPGSLATQTDCPGASGFPDMQDVCFRNGDNCFVGNMKFGEISMLDMRRVLSRVQQDGDGEMHRHQNFDKLAGNDIFRTVSDALFSTAEFIRDEIAGQAETLAEAGELGMNAWIDHCDDEEAYFELETMHGSSRWSSEDIADDMEDVEMACLRTFMADVQVTVVYHQGSFYCTLRTVDSEQPLLDEEFPVIGRRGQGYQIKTYNGDEVYRKLTLWQVQRRLVSLDDINNARSQLSKAGGSGEGKDDGDNSGSNAGEGKGEDRDDEQEEEDHPDNNRDITSKKKKKKGALKEHRLNEDGLSDGEESDGGDDMQDEMYPERAQGAAARPHAPLTGRASAFEGSYTQTYLLYKPDRNAANKIKRQAFFRYGNWCYGGHINLEDGVQLVEVPHVLRKFQKQQGRLQYMCEVGQLSEHLPFTAPMKHFAHASSFLEKQITGSEELLTRINDSMLKRDQQGWINEETGRQYFELSTTGYTPHYDNLELIASKTYFKEVVLITLYFRGSFYVTLSPCLDDQPLLDMSFPDVSSKCRGFQLKAYRHPEFSRLSIWDGTRSVWKVANDAVMADRRREAEEGRARKAAKRRGSTGGTLGTQDKHVVESLKTSSSSANMVNDTDTDAGDESKTPGGAGRASEEDDDGGVEGKVSSVVVEDEQEVESLSSPVGRLRRQFTEGSLNESEGGAEEEARAKPSRNNVSLARVADETKTHGGSEVRAPHHIRPMAGIRRGTLDSLPDLGDAPWDEMGRPRKNVLGGVSNTGSSSSASSSLAAKK